MNNEPEETEDDEETEERFDLPYDDVLDAEGNPLPPMSIFDDTL